MLWCSVFCGIFGCFFFFSSRRRHTSSFGDWSSDVCSSDLGTLKSLLQHHSSKASILRHSAFFTVQFSNPYMTTGKTIALTRRTFVGKVMSLPLNMLSRLVITFLSRSKHLLISWLQSPSAVTLEPPKIKSDTVCLLLGLSSMVNNFFVHMTSRSEEHTSELQS